MKSKDHLINVMCVFFLLAGVVQANDFLFDFDPDGTDVAAGAASVTDLSSSVDGVFGGKTITLTASVGNDLGNSRDRGANTGPYNDMTRDFVQWAGGPSVDITISGLVANAEHRFTVWSGDLAGGQIKTTDHTVAGESGGGTVQHTSVSLTEENAAEGTSLHQVDLPNVFSTASGTLTYTINWVSGGGGATTLNGMQISFIPPSGTVIVIK